MKKYPVLCVDDEVAVLDSLALTLKRKYSVTTASSALEALHMLRELPETAVIISDVRMPEMDGISFLAASRTIVPTARRILLTGDADPRAPITAINTASIFRFLNKPCPSEQVLLAVRSAVEDYDSEMRDRCAIRNNATREAFKQDPITRLESRESFLETCELYAAARAAENPQSLVVLLLEVDSPQDISEPDNYDATKHGLIVLATRLRDEMPLATCLGRYQANIFGALLPMANDSDWAISTLAKTLVDALEQPIILNGVGSKYRVRVGIARVSPHESSSRSVLRRAELALRDAKSHARTTVCIYSPELGQRFEHRCRLVQALKSAVAEEKLILHYQPIVDVSLGQIYSLEALARWEDPSLGKIPPDVFIPLAESLGLMSSMTGWALSRASFDGKSALSSMAERVSVNVSIAQLMDENFFQLLASTLEKSGLAASALELEVTESVFADDIKAVCLILTQVRALGVRISIDDFGTGYSSLAYLSQLPVDALKVDRSFVRDFDRGGDAIIGAALEMASKLIWTSSWRAWKRRPHSHKSVASEPPRSKGIYSHVQCTSRRWNLGMMRF